MITHVTQENFEEEVKNSKVPVLADFWAAWCAPCQMMGPVFEELSEEYAGKAKFVKVDVEQENALANQFAVQSIPTLIVLENGEEKNRLTGFAPKPVLKARIDAML